MSRTTFDAKFGESFLDQVPGGAGVYRYLSADGGVLYVGKAKNLRKRLASYRNASRKRAHRKMRIVVREAHSLVFETCDSEREALLRESQLIRELRPRFNVDGAYAFLYPSLGFGFREGATLLCMTTKVAEFEGLGLEWFGCFRSRPRVKRAFESLLALLGMLGHRESSRRLPVYPRIKGSRLVGFRQVPLDVRASLPDLFGGETAQALSMIATRLLSKPRALANPAAMQAHLDALSEFYVSDARRLRHALNAAGRAGTLVDQDERDALFISVSSESGAHFDQFQSSPRRAST